MVHLADGKQFDNMVLNFKPGEYLKPAALLFVRFSKVRIGKNYSLLESK